MRRVTALLLFTLAFVLAACGGLAHSPAGHQLSLRQAAARCPTAANGQGSMGVCAPAAAPTLSLAPPRGLTYPDRSNNDPLGDVGLVARAGHPALVVKINQGAGFLDLTAAPMLTSARAHGLAVGGYDFVQDYDATEAYVFVSRLRSVHACTGHGVLPPTLDVEFGAFSYSGLLHMLAIVRRSCGSVKIYTGAWYWTPHAGCQWPSGVDAWISGYPNAILPCGLPISLYREHQYTDSGFDGAGLVDMTVFRGSTAQWRAFAHLANPKPRPVPHPKPKPVPHPKPKPAPKHRSRQLARLYTIRHEVRAHQVRAGCLRPHHLARCAGLSRHLAVLAGQIRALHARGLY